MVQDSPLFGTAGLSESYRERGYKDILGAVAYTKSFGLDAFEYQFGHGVRLKEANAEILRQAARESTLLFSAHAPYYITMSGEDEGKRLGSLRYLLQTARAVRSLGGDRVIFHPGSVGKRDRKQAMEKAMDTLIRARALLDEEGFEEIRLCPETMGKKGQLGTLAEVLALCALDRRHIPCLDLGHLYAREGGGLQGKKAYAAMLDTLEEVLGDERAGSFHVHFSKIEYGRGGERRHLNFADKTFGPDYRPFLELLVERELSPVIICESAGRQAEDAAEMRSYYYELKKGRIGKEVAQ